MTKKIVSQVIHPPVVAVLGHVDHGKTTLLDAIRKTNIAQKEFAGITQHIGAYQIETPQGKITFIDTPGHEAFAKMRTQGALASDIAILVVAANDGVMPQTIESINHIKSAKIPCLVALNKIDLPNISLEKIKKQLTKAGLDLEEYGGNTPIVPISAKKGQGIEKLLEMILLLAELYQNKKDTKSQERSYGVVIEGLLSSSKGPTATIIVKNGTFRIGETVICNNQEFKIRALTDWKGNNLKEVSCGDPAEILGWKYVPDVGSQLFLKNQGASLQISSPLSKNKPLVSQDDKIKIILKADTAGTLEAVANGLSLFAVEIITSGIGNISESDVLMAKTTKAIIIGFHLKPADNIVKLATTEKIIIKTYNVIYELFNEVKDVIEALKKGDLVAVLGEAKIIALFPIKNDLIVGAKVVSGRVAKGDQVKIIRNNEEIAKTRIKSLRFHKEDITKAEQGSETGIMFSQKLELLTGDSIISIG